MADPRQVEAWFEEFEPQLVKEVDFLWWPQLLPLTVGKDMVTDNNAKRLARRLVASLRWAKQWRGPNAAPQHPPYST